MVGRRREVTTMRRLMLQAKCWTHLPRDRPKKSFEGFEITRVCSPVPRGNTENACDGITVDTGGRDSCWLDSLREFAAGVKRDDLSTGHVTRGQCGAGHAVRVFCTQKPKIAIHVELTKEDRNGGNQELVVNFR